MLATPRYRAGTRLGQIVELPDGQFFTLTAEGKPPFQETLGGAAFDDPWTPERLVMRRGRGIPIVWSEPEVVHTMPGSAGLWTLGRALVDRNGDLHGIGMRFLKWPKDIERPGRDELRCDVYHVASRDGGATWEPPHRVDYGREYTGALLGFTQLSSGRLLLPLHFYDFDREAGKNVAKSCYSDDGGRTWHADSTEVPGALGRAPQPLGGGGAHRRGAWRRSGLDGHSHSVPAALRIVFERRTNLDSAATDALPGAPTRPARPRAWPTGVCCSFGTTRRGRPLAARRATCTRRGTS